jgi:uncharacterized protein YjdB
MATEEAARAPGREERRGWRRHVRRSVAALLAACALGAAGCGDSPTSADPVQQVVIEPATPEVALGETVQLTATVRDASGQPLAGRAVVWTSGDPATAVVDGNGLVTPARAGRVQIAASSEGQSGIVEVRITPKRVRTVTIELSANRVEVGDTVAVQVAATAADGERLSDRPSSITSSASGVAAVTASGSVVAVAPGSAQITADVEGVGAGATIEVVPAAATTITLSSAEVQLAPDQTTTIGVTARDRRGNVLSGRAASFTSSATGIATVDAGGTIRGVAPGTAIVTVKVEQAEATVTVRVTDPPTPLPAPVARIDLSTGDFTLTVNDTRTVGATLRDAAGNALADRPVAWSSSNTSVASVSATGLVRGIAPGTARIDVRAEGVTASVNVTVSAAPVTPPPPAPVARVTVAPGTVSLAVGATRTLTATTTDASGSPLAGRAVSWSSSATSVATVTSAGLVRAVGPGTATITATSEGVSGTASVTVTAPVARIDLSTGDFTLTVGETRTVGATPRDAAGNALADRPVTWSSSNTSVASVSPTGVVSALGPGTARIDVRSEDVTVSVTVTVTPVPVGRVTVTPGTVSLEVGATRALTATTADAAGNPLSGRTVSWSSSATSVATVNGSGLVTAVGVGTATITATSEGVSGTASVTVTAPPAVPGPPVRLEIVSGNEQAGLRNAELADPLVVRAVDAAGRPVPGVFILWTPSDGGVATPGLALTNEAGEASTRWRLSDKNGGQQMRASAIGVPSITFTAVARSR